MTILAIIPARAGSKRVPQKNFRPFGNTTLTDLAIQQALDASSLSHIVLSSDSPAVCAIGAQYPTVQCLNRPIEISGDASPAIEYVRHALGALENDALRFDLVVVLQPSSPLRTASDIDATVQLLLDNPGADSAVSVVKIDQMQHPLKLKTLKNKALMPLFEEEAGRFLAQDLPEVYVRNGAVYATWRRDLDTRNDVIGQHSLAFLMPPERSVDINELIDFEFGEYLYLKNR